MPRVDLGRPAASIATATPPPPLKPTDPLDTTPGRWVAGAAGAAIVGTTLTMATNAWATTFTGVESGTLADVVALPVVLAAGLGIVMGAGFGVLLGGTLLAVAIIPPPTKGAPLQSDDSAT